MNEDRESSDREDPDAELNSVDEGRSKDGDRYVPTPEELESGDAPEVRGRSQEEVSPEQASGFFGRFRMRRRKGVGEKRRYEKPGAEAGGDIAEEDGPREPEPVELHVPDQTPDRGIGRGDTGKVLTPVASGREEFDEEEQEDESTEVGRDEPSDDSGDDELTGGEDSHAGDREPDTRRVDSVSFKKKKKKPERQPSSQVYLSQKDRRVADLYRKTAEHGHSMGHLQHEPGTENSVARCSDCGLSATVVASGDDMSLYVRYDLRGPALEQTCGP